MSRVAKWKPEKVKVKVVFRLQFHATHIPQTGWDKLFISSIPADSGKVTAKTSKSNVRNGTCKWADPIYETTRLLQDIKTKQYDGKLYKLAVAMGSSRSSLLGEASINLADYADASKPSTVALPLQGCNYGTVLHVTVQLLTSKTGFREFEQQRELREGGLHITTNSHDEPAEQLSTSSNMRNDQIDKANARVRFKSEARDLPSLEEEVELNEDSDDLAGGIDNSSNTSESFYAEKHDSSTHEIDSLKSTASGDLGGHSLSQSPREKGDPSEHQLLAQRSSDWVHGWSSDYSMDNELASASEENSRLRGKLELAESSIVELKMEVSSLQSHADELGAETQKFSQLIAAEIASGEELAKEIFVLKSECSKLKDDVEHLQHSKINSSVVVESVQRNQLHLFQGLQIKWLKGLLILEEKVREVQNKICLQYHNTDVDYLNPEFEALELLLGDLKHGTKQTMSLLTAQQAQAIISETAVIIAQNPEQYVSENRFKGTNSDQYYFEDMVHGLREHEQVTQDHVPTVATIALEEKVSELQQELEESKTERDNLTRKMDQMECYYEALIQELEENQKHMLGELQNLRNEHSSCLYAISSCKSQMEKAHEDMNEQLMRISEEKHQLDSLNKELERRAIASETALERARWNYSIAVDQLQKDLQLLSLQVLSMFETSENLVRKAFLDSSESCFQDHLEENSEAINSCLHDEYISFLQNQYKTKAWENKVKFSESQKIDQALPSHKVVSFPNFVAQREIGDVHSDLVVEAGKDFDVSDSLICRKSNNDCISKYNLHSADSDTGNWECQQHNAEQKDQFSGGDILFGEPRGSHHLQKELYQKFEHDLFEVQAANIHLDVFSKVLQETLCEISTGNKQLKQEINVLSQQLAHSSKSNEFLTARLQVALDDLNTLTESKAHSVVKCDELALQNQVLEEKFQSMFNENCLLNQKVQEYESRVLEYKNIGNMYEACTAEKIELLNLLKQETLEMCSLRNVVSSLNEDLNSLKEDFDKQSVVKNKLEKTVIAVRERLRALWSAVIALDVEINESSLCFPLQQDTEEKVFISSILHLEDLLSKAHEKILQLTQGLKDAEEQRGIAQQLLISKESKILFLKKKYESDVHNMGTKIDASNALVEKLQLELENIATKFMNSHDAEERYAEESKEIYSRLAVIELELQNATSDNNGLVQKILDLERVNEELQNTKQDAFYSLKEDFLKQSMTKNKLEKTVLTVCEKLGALWPKVIALDEEMNGSTLCFPLQQEMEERDFISSISHLEELLQKAHEKILQLTQGVKDVEEQRGIAQQSLISKESEILFLKSKYESDVHNLVTKIDTSNALVEKLQLEFASISSKLIVSHEAEERYAKECKEVSSRLDVLEVELQDATSDNSNLAQKILDLEGVNEELERTKQTAISYMQEKQELMMSLQAGNEESLYLEKELCSMKEVLQSTRDELHSERSLRLQLEGVVTDLSCQLNVKSDQILSLDKEKAEVVRLKQLALDLELEKSKLSNLLLHSEELLRKADESALSLHTEVADLQNHLLTFQEYGLAADVELICTRNQLQSRMGELVQQLESLDRCYRELHLKHLDVLTTLNGRISSEAQYVEENARLLAVLNSLRSEMEVTVTEKNNLVSRNNHFLAELELYKTKAEISDEQNKHLNELEIEKLKHMLLTCEEAIDNLRSSRDEHEITVIVLRAKLDEQINLILLLKEYGNELTVLQNHNNELARRLSEQTLKTEEFKNLSAHLKELKDKADAECLLAREKKETEAPPIAVQESLRIAFIREQCETKLQELKNQLFISKKHGEEMLLKLQDALDEVENQKRSEASHKRKNEELSLKILDLESELQMILADKREKAKASDEMKAELECSLISLDCCREEKKKLEDSLRECIEERTKASIELSVIKEQLESSRSPTNARVEENLKPYNPGLIPINNVALGDASCEKQDGCLVPMQDSLKSKTEVEISNQAVIDQENLRQLALINKNFAVQSLKTSLGHLHEELEKMKKENLASIPQDANYFDPAFQGLERDILRLNKANEQLSSIFPSFNEFPCSGNALDRVLALEIELAEALQAKKKSNFHLQSSFLKQHNDEEAVFQSFRDINELIKDMLELKGRYVAVETELKEMHDRYSQLSLHFAEVEGERQKLVMTLKNSRIPKKSSSLQCSTSATSDD